MPYCDAIWDARIFDTPIGSYQRIVSADRISGSYQRIVSADRISGSYHISELYRAYNPSGGIVSIYNTCAVLTGIFLPNKYFLKTMSSFFCSNGDRLFVFSLSP